MSDKLKNLSGNSLSELNTLIGKINFLIERDFCHVSELLPNSITKNINDFSEKIASEFDRRESE